MPAVAKSVRDFTHGDIVFLVKFDIKNHPEIVVQVDSYDSKTRVIKAKKVLQFVKEVDKKTGGISLQPVAGAYILSSMNVIDENNVSRETIFFNLDNFDAYGHVINEDILEIFKDFED